MSFGECINNGEAEGKITADRAAEARRLYDEARAALKGTVSEAELDAAAARLAFDKMERRALDKRRVTRLTQLATHRVETEMSDYVGPKGPDMGRALLSYYYDDGFGRSGNLRDRHKAVQGYVMSGWDNITEDFMRTMLGGTRRSRLLDDVIDESFGARTGNAKAADYAKRINEGAEKLRQMFNAAGGHIGKIENWGWPTRHNKALFSAAKFEDWRDYLLPRLNLEKMLDRETGKALTFERLDELLRDMFEAVKTDNWSRREPGAGAFGAAMRNRHAEERFLIFKDGASWREYQERFGDGKPWDVMLEHMDGLSKDVAAMGLFGPNPVAMQRFMGDKVKQAAATADMSGKAKIKAEDKAKERVQIADAMWRVYTGEMNQPVNVKAADFNSAVRSYLTGTLLTSTSLIAAPTDIANQVMARKFAGLRASRIIADYVKMFNPLNRDDRNIAQRAGILSEHMLTTGLAASRFNGERTARGIAGQYADTSLRLTGLSQMTQAGRSAMGKELLMVLGENADKPFDQLNDGLQRILRRGGLEADWDVLRSVPMIKDNGVTIMGAQQVERLDLPTEQKRDLIVKLLTLTNMNMEFSVPTGSLRSQAFLRGRTQPGTLSGEVNRSFTMFKSFPVTVLMMQIGRTQALYAEQGMRGAAAHMASYLIFTTVAGALGLQMQEISKGRDPVDMNGRDFWAAAMLKGGGLGIWGDVLASGEQGYSLQSLSTLAAGPVAGLGDDLLDVTVGNAKAAARGDDMKLGKDATDLTRNYTPLLRSFYTRTAFERLVVDEMQKQLDPNAYESFQRKVRFAERENDQSYWWAPGDRAPARAPDLGAATGG